MLQPKFKVGDEVDFVNDFGIVFNNKKIIGINYDFSPGDITYNIKPTETPWYPAEEKNLYSKGTYQKPNLDEELLNGKIAKFLHYDDNCQKVFEVGEDVWKINVVLIDGILYSISTFGEPLGKIDEEYQLKN